MEVYENFDGEFLLLNDSVKSKPRARISKRDSIKSFQAVDPWTCSEKHKDCVRFFKQKNTKSDKYPEIEFERFCLLLMTKPQPDFLKTFSQRLVCIDNQAGENFTILTLLVLDDKEQCLPCAFFFTDELETNVIELFFKEVANICGKIETNLLLSDNDIISNTWDDVMGKCERQMLCSWDVINDWVSNLSEVKDRSKLAIIVNKLEKLVKEKDISDFLTLYPSLLQELENDPETEDFAAYLSEHYLDCPQIWACCYRFEDEGTQGFTELSRVHSSLEFIVQARATKTLPKALNTVLDFLRNKIYDRLLVRSESKVASKLYETSQKHRAAGQQPYEITSHGDFWTIVNARNEHHVVRVSNTCCPCRLKCDICNVCAHAYVCTCATSLLHMGMCRHIHAVCTCEAAIKRGSSSQLDGKSSCTPARESLEAPQDVTEVKDVCVNQTKLKQSKEKYDKSTPITNFEGLNNNIKCEPIEADKLKMESVDEVTIESNQMFETKNPQMGKSNMEIVTESVETQYVEHEELLIDDYDDFQYEEGSVEVVDSGCPDEKVLSYLTVSLDSPQEKEDTSSNDVVMSRIDGLKNVFKNILDQVNSDEEIAVVEKAVLSLQKIFPEVGTNTSKRKAGEGTVSSSPLKQFKIHTNNENISTAGKRT